MSAETLFPAQTLIIDPNPLIINGEHLRVSRPVSLSLLALNTQGQEVVGISLLVAAIRIFMKLPWLYTQNCAEAEYCHHKAGLFITFFYS